MSGKRRAAVQEVQMLDGDDSDAADDAAELSFEDDTGDEAENGYEEEEMADAGEEGGEEGTGGAGSSSAAPRHKDGVRSETVGQLWRAGDALPAGEQLDFDSSAYDMLHRLHMEWPCLTFGVVKDNMGEQRTKFPMTAYAVAGTQADKPSNNKLVVTKLSQLAKTRHDDDSESDEEESESEDEDPLVESRSVAHEGTVNRLRLMPQSSHVCASWADTGKVHIWDLSAQLAALHAPGGAKEEPPPSAGPVYTFGGHRDEGYALDWSPTKPGALVTGDCANAIHLWSPTSAGSWAVDPEPFVGHTASVEDVAWSPVEPNVLMSCGCDSTVRVWDVRRKGGSALTVDEGHKTDVNVISWNKLVNYLVVSGADDGSFRVWDLRSFASGKPVANFHWHTKAVTSVEWSPSESSTIAVAGADNQVTLWDLALEDDPEAESAVRGRADLKDIPPQLYFVHQGQTDVKEIHWHPQLPGVLASTAADSFHVFKPANSGDGPAE